MKLPPLTGSMSVAPMPVPGIESEAPAVVTTVANEAPEMRVKGLMGGEDPVAVIAIGKKSHVVRPGQSFGDGMTLVSIDGRRVVVSRNGEEVSLTIGQRK